MNCKYRQNKIYVESCQNNCIKVNLVDDIYSLIKMKEVARHKRGLMYTN